MAIATTGHNTDDRCHLHESQYDKVSSLLISLLILIGLLRVDTVYRMVHVEVLADTDGGLQWRSRKPTTATATPGGRPNTPSRRTPRRSAKWRSRSR